MLVEKIGILGGGQLGKMLAQQASKWSLDITILEKDRSFPAGQTCVKLEEGDFRNYDDVIRFGSNKDILSIEIEGVNVEALKALSEQGKKIYPDPRLLEIIVDKGLQKQWIHSMGLPTASFRLFGQSEQIHEAVVRGEMGLPAVQKLRMGGYDGRAVQLIRSEQDLELLLNGPSMVEDMIDIQNEISVIGARNVQGEIRIYPATEMVFDHRANLLDTQICPARINEETEERARDIALRFIQSAHFVGLVAVEMFLDKQGKLWVNELAPRPHNSGHHTIEASVTSQYEQHLRSITGLPLGNTQMLTPSVLVNLLGSEGYQGKAHYTGLPECLSLEGVHIHIYGKTETRPFRKMGHVTVVADHLEAAIERAKFVKEHLKVIA